MSSRQNLLGRGVLLLLGFVVLVFGWRWLTWGPEKVKISLSGAPGVMIAGSYTVDGVASSFEHGLPYEITIEAKTVAFEAKKAAGDGKVALQLFVGDSLLASAEGPRGVNGTAELGPFGRTLGANGF
jgi:hypothetical protein